MYGVLGMKWVDDFVREVQVWVEKLVCVCILQYLSKSERKNVGENLVMFMGKFDFVGEEVIIMW